MREAEAETLEGLGLFSFQLPVISQSLDGCSRLPEMVAKTGRFGGAAQKCPTYVRYHRRIVWVA